MFPVRAAFWVLVVAAFVPKGFSAPSDGAFAQEAALIAAQFDAEGYNVQAAAGDVCTGREQACALVGEAADLAGFMVSIAADRAETIAARGSGDAEADTVEQLFAEAAGERPAG
jgi:hypothetical protein